MRHYFDYCYYYCSSFTAIQQRRSKTQWHKPLTNTIFSTHFKDTSRNKELHIEQLVAKGAYGVVFKVIDKEHRNQNKKQYIDNNIDDVLLPNGTYALKVLKKSKVLLFIYLLIYLLIYLILQISNFAS